MLREIRRRLHRPTASELPRQDLFGVVHVSNETVQ